MAMILHSAGRDAEAEPLARRALALRQGQLGPTQGLVGGSLRQIGEIRLARHDVAGAEPLLTQALTILRKDFGPAHALTGQAELSMARLRAAQKRQPEANALVAEILKTFPPSDVEYRRLRWEARTLSAQWQCAIPDQVDTGQRNLRQIKAEIDSELPVSVIEREAAKVLAACGG